MRSEIQRKLDKIHDGILKEHNGSVMLLYIIYVATVFINYYIINGLILDCERKECYEYIANKVYFKYNCTMPLAREGWMDMMNDYKGDIKKDNEIISKYKDLIDKA